MSGVGLEVLLEGLIPEIAYSGEKGASHAAWFCSTPWDIIHYYSGDAKTAANRGSCGIVMHQKSVTRVGSQESMLW